MGFFKDFKEDLTETAKNLQDEEADNVMVNTLDSQDKSEGFDLSEIAAAIAKEADLEEEFDDGQAVEDEEEVSDETAVITMGLNITGNMESKGSIDILGTVVGDVTCRGKLTISGSVAGVSKAREIFANNAKIEGDMVAKGSVKIGQGTVIVGNVSATSAVIAGAVKGDIDINGPVIIDATAVIVGDIKSKSVQINNGATIEGRCSQCYADVDTSDLFDIKLK